MTPATKSGRCADGAERGKGSVVHWISNNAAEAVGRGGSYWKATCGAQPGMNTPGWTLQPAETPITCPACKRRHDATTPGAPR